MFGGGLVWATACSVWQSQRELHNCCDPRERCERQPSSVRAADLPHSDYGGGWQESPQASSSGQHLS